MGALPIATTAPAIRSPHRSSAAAERVVPSRAASAGTSGWFSVQTTSLPAGRRARVMPCATISASHSTGRPASSAARAAPAKPGLMRSAAAISTMPQAWMTRTATRASSGAKPDRSASARMVAKERR